MDAGTWIAAYAAVVATGAALWPVWQAVRSRRPSVDVVLTPALEDEDESQRALVVEIRNHGSLPVHIRAVGVDDGTTPWIFQPNQITIGSSQGEGMQIGVQLNGPEFPERVPAQDSRAFVLPHFILKMAHGVADLTEEYGGTRETTDSLRLNLNGRLSAWVALATGHLVVTTGRLDWTRPMILPENVPQMVEPPGNDPPRPTSGS
jgi:hypothetical protein